MARKTTRILDLSAFLVRTSVGRSGVSYRRKQAIFAQGEPADAIFYIQKGRVKLTVVSKQGKEAVVGLLGPNDFFGEGCLAGQTVRMSSATAVDEVRGLRVRKASMVRLLSTQPKFSEMFMTHLLSRNIRFEEDLVDQLFNSSEKRLARVLLLLAQFGKEGRPEPVVAQLRYSRHRPAGVCTRQGRSSDSASSHSRLMVSSVSKHSPSAERAMVTA